MDLTEMRPGALPREHLKELKGRILFDATEIGESSIDLHLSSEGWEMKGSLKLAKDISFPQVVNDSYCRRPLDLKKENILSPRNTYVIKLKENIKGNEKKNYLFGQATGKSSVGRLDVLTRLLADRNNEFDNVPENYNGPLYVEVTPITFPIIVKEGYSLNQLRLFRGEPELSRLSPNELHLYPKLIKTDHKPTDLTLNLDPIELGDKYVIAFQAKKPDTDSEFEPIDIGKPGKADPNSCWKLIPPREQNDILIEKDRFYILRSKERFTLPADVGVHCQAITENLGEIRIHYAGFVHPGFGRYREDGKGAPLIFEVRGHTVDAFLRHGELMAHISYYRMSQPVDFSEDDIQKMKDEAYNNQELELSKYFSKWN